MPTPVNPVGPGGLPAVPRNDSPQVPAVPTVGGNASRPADILRADATRGAIQLPTPVGNGGTTRGISPGNGAAPSGAAGGISGAGGSGASGLDATLSVIGQLLDQMGGGAATDRELELLIALLILLVLLSMLQEQNGDTQSPLGQGGLAGGMEAYSETSVSISLEQTTTVVGLIDASTPGAAGNPPGEAGQGRTLDVSA